MWGEFFFYIKVFGTVCRHSFWALWADPFVHNSSVFNLNTAWVWNILQAAHSPDIIQYFILGQMQHCWVPSGARAGWMQFIVGLDLIQAHPRAALVRIWMFHPFPDLAGTALQPLANAWDVLCWAIVNPSSFLHFCQHRGYEMWRNCFWYQLWKYVRAKTKGADFWHVSESIGGIAVAISLHVGWIFF